MRTERQLCTFLMGGLTFGVPVDRVQEVMRFQPMTRVPLANHSIAGLINLRGQIVTAVDLRRRGGQSQGYSTRPNGDTVGFCLTPGYETYEGLGWYGVLIQGPAKR